MNTIVVSSTKILLLIIHLVVDSLLAGFLRAPYKFTDRLSIVPHQHYHITVQIVKRPDMSVF